MAAQPSTQQARPTHTGHALLRWRRQQLQAGGNAADLDWLLDLEGGVAWRDLQRLRLSPDQSVTLAVPLEGITALWQRHRATGEPLQYLVGRCPWRDLELAVGPGVLIPRQETELLVEIAQERMGQAPWNGSAARWADLGTGSGCLAAALARSWPVSQGWAVDLSNEALALAARNLHRHGLDARVTLRQGSWWEPLRPQWGHLQLVVANPPYIPDAVWSQLDPVVRDHEPRLALSSGADGLEAIRTIAAGAAAALAPGGWLLLEHHHDQSPAVLALLQRSGLQAVAAHRDLEGVARFASAQRPAPA
jgi:release factor glutamine methyltransferase